MPQKAHVDVLNVTEEGERVFENVLGIENSSDHFLFGD